MAENIEVKFIRCPHGGQIESVRLGDKYLLLCQECYFELESQFLASFLHRTIRMGVLEGVNKFGMNRK